MHASLTLSSAHGVIFALKVLSSTYTPEDVWLMGWLPVPSRYACWAELILIQILSPNASFVGHLAGILAGLLYTMGPLRWIVNGVASVVEGVIGGGEGRQQRDRDYSSASAPPYEGGRTWGDGREERRGGSNYERYTGGLSEEEQIRHAMEESMRQRRQPNYGWNID
ncbi:hypothetical protein PRIPAC_74197 [Pristionchus pacificus]|nr:hypothetical protein PRIPAC_74197 [Pristionchus pacificus]